MLYFKYFASFQLTITAFHLYNLMKTFWQFYDMHIMYMLVKGNQTSAV